MKLHGRLSRRVAPAAAMSVLLVACSPSYNKTRAEASKERLHALAKVPPPASAAVQEAPTRSDSILAVLKATQGSYQGDKLVLTGVGAYPTWFTNRPARDAGSMAVPALLDVFFKRQSPPNSAVVVDSAPASNDVVIVELSAPQYDEAFGSLSFTAALIKDVDAKRAATHPSLGQFTVRNDGVLPATFGSSSVFLDSAADTNLTPDEQMLSGMLQEANELVQNWEVLQYHLNVKLDQNYTIKCDDAMRDVTTDIFIALTRIIRPIKQWQKDTAANNGVLPANDAAAVPQVRTLIASGQSVYKDQENYWNDGQRCFPP